MFKNPRIITNIDSSMALTCIKTDIIFTSKLNSKTSPINLLSWITMGRGVILNFQTLKKNQNPKLGIILLAADIWKSVQWHETHALMDKLEKIHNNDVTRPNHTATSCQPRHLSIECTNVLSLVVKNLCKIQKC